VTRFVENATDPPSPFGSYVHVPFCASKCEYCAFATWTDRHHLADEYLSAVRDEIDLAVAGGLRTSTSVFVGGGTPSLVDPLDLMSVVAAIPRTPDAEVTVECNPDDVTHELLETYASAGVNRISLGVQSMSTVVLGVLGRRHDRENVERAVAAIRSVGIPTFNLDLIYGAVGESVDDWHETVRAVVDLGPPHVSAYALTVEAGTPLAARHDLHPDDDDQADKYEVVDDTLVAAGLENYEISNWSLPGHECRHNLLYWRQQDYRGFGCAAHSHEAGRRWWNVRTPDRYIELVTGGGSPEAACEILDEATRRFEHLELMLRLPAGVPLDALDGATLPGLVERVGDRWVLTRHGRLLANDIATRLLV
jgi:oxygen-independent coproporphyrinogen-3 oxidase